MKQETVQIEGKTYNRVNVSKFKRLLSECKIEAFRVCPSNVSTCADIFVYHGDPEQEFWKENKNIGLWLNDYCYYNCQLRETGYYPKFYVCLKEE